jgi:hypothetical protein
LKRVFGPKREERTGDREIYLMRIFMTVLLATYYYDDKIQEDDVRENWRIILKWILKKLGGMWP